MRGSIYYQSSVLTKLVFKSGSKKIDRKDYTSDEYKLVASYNSMDSYRKIWNDLGFYIYDVYGIKNFEKITSDFIEEFMYEKIAQGISHKYLQKISSAIGKLEFALNQFSILQNRGINYDFSIRLKIVKTAKKQELASDNYRDRAYAQPKLISQFLDDEKFEIAANVQLESGTRFEGIGLVKANQLKGFKIDLITNKKVGVITTKEKGGKIGDIHMSTNLYIQIENIILKAGVFKIDYRKYTSAIGNACRVLNCKSEGTHGFRWNFAQKRVIEYIEAGYTHSNSLQMVSYEMKHNRPDITLHYIG